VIIVALSGGKHSLDLPCRCQRIEGQWRNLRNTDEATAKTFFNREERKEIQRHFKKAAMSPC
jgi:hypothetical protein